MPDQTTPEAQRRPSAPPIRRRAVDTSVVVTVGESPEAAVLFRTGSPVQPFGVGTVAQWRVSAAGVARLHFFLCFDGETLFAARALGAPHVLVGASPLPTRWVKIPPSCEIKFGDARLRIGASISQTDIRPAKVSAPVLQPAPARPSASAEYVPYTMEEADEPGTLVRYVPEAIRESMIDAPCDVDLDAPTIARSSPAPVAPVAPVAPAKPPPARPRALPCDKEELKTTIEPAPARSRATLRPDRLRSMLEVTIIKPLVTELPASASAPLSTGSESAVVLPISREQREQPTVKTRPSRQGGRGAALVQAWRAMSRARRINLVVAPIALLAVAIVFLADLVPIPSPAIAAGKGRPSTTRPARSSPRAAPSPSATAASSHAAPAAPTTSPAEVAPAALDDSNANGRTLERRAADAVAVGGFSEAAVLYDRLAKDSASASAEVFREAGRIARRKQPRAP